MSHTPGPWMWDDDDLYPEGPREAYKAAVEAAIVDEESVYPEWVEPIVQTDSGVYGPHGADRALIAAAPDLLEAARAIQETCPCDPDSTKRFEAAWAQLEAAVKKAEGVE